jgi:hypothetical protein
MKSIHSTFFLKSVFAALVLCFSLGAADYILLKYKDSKYFDIKYTDYLPFILLVIRTPLIIFFSEFFLYLFYFYEITL